MQQIDMSNEKPMVSAYPPRPLAEPRSGRYAGCKSAESEVFGCIPHGARAYRESDSFAMWAVGWDNYFQCGYPTRMFDKVNWYVRNRLYLHLTGRAKGIMC